MRPKTTQVQPDIHVLSVYYFVNVKPSPPASATPNETLSSNPTVRREILAMSYSAQLAGLGFSESAGVSLLPLASVV